MKRILLFLLVFTVSLTLTGCDLLGIETENQNPNKDQEEPVSCIPGYFEQDGGCVEIVTQDDCEVDEMVVDNTCVENPDYVAPLFPVLPGPDYTSQGYDEYLGRDLVVSECSHLDNIGEWQPVWCDEFEYEGLPDPTKWGYDVGGSGWGNNELQYYTGSDLDNAYVKDGYLTIEAIQESMNGRDYTSARLITKNKGDWTYGKMQIRARVPGGLGTWPAAWMLPTDWEYGGWPDSGEIDIMEYVGYDKNKLHATIHTGAFNHSIGTQVGKAITVSNMETEFHVFEMEWEPNVIRYYVDGNLFYTVSYNPDTSYNVEPWEAWPFDKDFHLLLNLAFGGNWGGAQGVDYTLDNMKYEIDYVRIYQKDYAGMDQEAPSTVENIRVLSSTSSGVFIAWDVAEDDVMIEKYEVYYNDVLFEVVTHNAIHLKGITEDGILKIIAVDFAGNKSASSQISVEGPSIPTVNDRIEAENYVSMNGMQVEPSTDTGGGFNIGYVTSGDYVTYVIEVTESGTYKLNARVASLSNGGSFILYSNETPLTTVLFNATGGWQNWTTVQSEGFYLNAGTYTFKIQATKDDWNINYFEFEKIN